MRQVTCYPKRRALDIKIYNNLASLEKNLFRINFNIILLRKLITP
jgi:hypothetical protein